MTNNQLKLSATQVTALTMDVVERGMSYSKAAEKYGIHRSTVGRLIQGRAAEGGPRELKPCGTNAAYMRHVRKKEKPCLPCYDAHAKNNRTNRSAPAQDATSGWRS